MSSVRRAALLWLLSTVGCAETFCSGKPYQPLVVSSLAPPQVLLDAAERAARDLGASSVETARADLRLSAVFAERDHQREHLRVQVTAWGVVSIDLRTELQADDGAWIAPDTVCDDYSHSREQRVAEKLLLLARSA